MEEILKKPLNRVINLKKEYFEFLKDLNIFSLSDLLLYLPRTYEEAKVCLSVTELNLQEKNQIELIFQEKQSMLTKNRKKIYKAWFKDKNNYELEAVWFHKPYKLDYLKEGQKIVLVGKFKYEYGNFFAVSPEINNLSEINKEGIIPIYPASEKISSKYIQKKIALLSNYFDKIPENLPEEIIKRENFLPRKKALKILHFPKNLDLLNLAKERMAFEELFFIHKKAFLEKQEFKKNAVKYPIKIPFSVDLVKDFFKNFDFVPTNSQKIAIYEILQDLDSGVPMNRLLEGDVGSGKTFVAMLAIYCAIKNGFQVALMVPTEVLARQHYSNFKKIFDKLNLKTEILLGAQKKSVRTQVKEELNIGKIDLIIGTHALIQADVNFKKLGLVIIDEQHRFGVEQRKNLLKNGSPHLLMMTATPIPRTLSLVAFASQDLSVLTEMPPNRKPIITKLITNKNRQTMINFIDLEISKGKQVYVVCPLIEDSESEMLLEVKSVTKELNQLKKDFSNRKIEVLHGKMKSEEKQKIMQEFLDKKFDILLSTSVIEVGIDIKNANIMIIEGAERFGLSQLHQIRGRVGRSKEQSYCFLAHTKEKNTERLKAMEKYQNGFQIAEIDLKLRGPGEIYGLKQSGVPDLRMATLSDHKFVVKVKKIVDDYLSDKKSSL
jgi:ATP-dependent DNA helicase RecG